MAIETSRVWDQNKRRNVEQKMLRTLQSEVLLPSFGFSWYGCIAGWNDFHSWTPFPDVGSPQNMNQILEKKNDHESLESLRLKAETERGVMPRGNLADNQGVRLSQIIKQSDDYNAAEARWKGK